MNKRKFARVSILFLTLAIGNMPDTAFSQLSGHNSMGDYGMFSGTQSPPGWYLAAPMYYRYSADEFRDRNGDRLLAVEGGGIAYYGQWKISDDDFGVELPSLPNRRLGKNRVYGIGPELTVPLATKKTLYGFLNLRYFWETGARSSLQGNTFVATMSFPIPFIPLQ